MELLKNKRFNLLLEVISSSVLSGWLSAVNHVSNQTRKKQLSASELDSFTKSGSQAALLHRGHFLASEEAGDVIRELCGASDDDIEELKKALVGNPKKEENNKENSEE